MKSHITSTYLEVYIYRTTDVDQESFSVLLEGANDALRHLRFSEGPIVPAETVTNVVCSACNEDDSLSRAAALYFIKGTPAERYSIALPREHVKWTDRDGQPVDCRQPIEM